MVSSGKCAILGSRSVVLILGRRCIELKITSKKVLPLQDVQQILDFRRSLVSGSLLVYSGFKIALEANRTL